jgi:molybdate transport system substrate-binding protein
VKRRGVAAAASLAFLLVAGLACGGGDDRPRVTVAAASDLRFAFEELKPLYEARCECDVVLSFGSSGTLATQIREGLRVDVFASANAGFVDDLERADLVLDGTRQIYAIGRIVIAASAGSELRAEELRDLLQPNVRRIAIANTEHAPYGMAARQALEKAGLWSEVQPRLVMGENASLATQYVETRNAEIGLVPLSLAIQREQYLKYALIDDALHEPLRQVAAVMKSSRHPDLARRFLDFVNGPEGRPIMREYGFVLPGEHVQQ